MPRGSGLRPLKPGDPKPAAKPKNAVRNAKQSAKRKLDRAVKQAGGMPGSIIPPDALGEILKACVIAYEVGSQDYGNRQRRVQVVARRLAKQYQCDEPVRLLERVKQIVERRKRGIATDLAADDLAKKELLAAAMAEQSDFLEAPDHTTAKQAREIARKAAAGAPILTMGPTKMAQSVRDPAKAPNHNCKPPVGTGGIDQAPADEAERRVSEIVKRLGLGATRQQLLEWAAKSWATGYSTRNVDEYIKAARMILRANWAREREDFMLDLLEQYQRLGADARVEGQLGTALGCLNSMAKLTSLGGFATGP